MIALRFVRASTAVILAIPALGVAQSLPRPERAWQTISTEHFDVHFPAEMREWSQPVAQRMESVAAAVQALVGNTPKARVTVLIEDPNNRANGFALPFLDDPVVFFWPTPPTPGPTFGDHRGWGEILSVHEYSHIAQLTYPTRNAFNRLLWKFSPAKLGPVARKSPAWIIEGYATYIEGKLTGNGRPHSVGRAAVLRTWALEGKLPAYDQLNSTRPFLGGAMRYLVGSAFIEWLAASKGDSSLVTLWRRMSARRTRSFNEAFRGTFGAYPDELYGRFFVEVTSNAIDIGRQLEADGLAPGELVQHYRWAVGGPTVSKDGRVVALAVSSPKDPPRIEVWRTAEDANVAREAEDRRRLLAADPLDVPAIDSFPPRRTVIATLRPSAGRAPTSPRFFDDNDRLLVIRDEPLGDGASRPDLFIWNYKTGSLRRVTHGAGIQSADPSPDGRQAAAVQCLNGICNLVLIDLDSGRIRLLQRGSPDIVWYRPRFAPDGKAVAASIQRDGRWRVALVAIGGSAMQLVDPEDGADRHSPAFTADGRQLILVSERGGIANLEVLDLTSHTPRTLTRVTSAVSAPDVSDQDGRVYFLTLHSRGYDVRRATLANLTPRPVATLSPQFFPVAPHAAVPRPPFAPGRVTGPRDYLTGPRRFRLLPGGTLGADGDMGTLSVVNTDPIGRVGVLAVGGYGDRSAWRGGSLAFETRRTPLHIGVAGWYAEQRPSAQKSWSDAPSSFDAKFVGAGGMFSMEREYARWGLLLRAGGSGGFLDGNQLDRDTRAMGLGEARLRLSFGVGPLLVTALGGFTEAQGVTADDKWSLGLTQGSMTLAPAAGRGSFLRLETAIGHVTPARSAEFGRAYEQFLVGGSELPFANAPYQVNRLAVPGVPAGIVAGQRVAVARAVLGGYLLEPSVTWVAAGDVRDSWKRVYAIEREFSFPSLGYVRLPAVHIRGGVSYSVDEPFERKVRPFLSLTYRP